MPSKNQSSCVAFPRLPAYFRTDPWRFSKLISTQLGNLRFTLPAVKYANASMYTIIQSFQILYNLTAQCNSAELAKEFLQRSQRTTLIFLQIAISSDWPDRITWPLHHVTWHSLGWSRDPKSEVEKLRHGQSKWSSTRPAPRTTPHPTQVTKQGTTPHLLHRGAVKLVNLASTLGVKIHVSCGSN